MATTTYNEPVAYNASLRYDGVYTPTEPTDEAPSVGFDPPRRRRHTPAPTRFITVTHHTRPVWVIATEITVPNEDELVLLGLL